MTINRASMRPRVFPAEDVVSCEQHRVSLRIASMRPRVFPAEDSVSAIWCPVLHTASMRPRVFPAEDPAGKEHPRLQPNRFNEAAGIPRGRRGDPVCR